MVVAERMALDAVFDEWTKATGEPYPVERDAVFMIKEINAYLKVHPELMGKARKWLAQRKQRQAVR